MLRSISAPKLEKLIFGEAMMSIAPSFTGEGVSARDGTLYLAVAFARFPYAGLAVAL
ncbi:MAG: hypothetical protein ABIR38_03175 [Chthoniobacterales bacterium]